MTTRPATAQLSLTPEVFAILTALIEERTGLHYEPRDLSLFAAKALSRVAEAGFASALDYYYYLRYDASSAGEFDDLVDALVVNETYFFREPDALRVVVSDMLAPAIARGQRPRVWCAACSTGEEPLTLAMLLETAGLGGRVEIVASDIGRRVLDRARAGVYKSRALRSLPAAERERFFAVEGEGDDVRATIAPELVARVAWRRLNLCDPAAVAALGSFDVIICRNVLIYFSDATIVRVVNSLSNALRPGGRLVVGASESLLRFGTLLECEERKGAFFYRRHG